MRGSGPNVKNPFPEDAVFPSPARSKKPSDRKVIGAPGNTGP